MTVDGEGGGSTGRWAVDHIVDAVMILLCYFRILCYKSRAINGDKTASYMAVLMAVLCMTSGTPATPEVAHYSHSFITLPAHIPGTHSRPQLESENMVASDRCSLYTGSS